MSLAYINKLQLFFNSSSTSSFAPNNKGSAYISNTCKTATIPSYKMSDSVRVTSDKVADSAAVELSGIIIIVTIMLLFLLVLLVIIFRLYSVRHHFWNRHASREPPSSDLPTLQQQRQGLDPSILKSIKIVQISAAEDKLGLECSVCLCQVSEGEKARFLPKCNHGFHMQCIDIWFHSHSTCPLCRNTVSISSDDLEAAPPVDAGGLVNSQLPIVSSSAPSSSRVRNDGHLAIDITNLRTEGEDQKSPVAVTPTAALYRSLSRLLSRNTRTSSP